MKTSLRLLAGVVSVAAVLALVATASRGQGSPDFPGAFPAAAPIGSVVAWLKGFEGTPPLPQGWAECNGQTLQLQGSPYNGKALPNLNGAENQPQRFLRGALQSGGVGGQETHLHSPVLVDRAPHRVMNVSAREPAPNLPPFYEVTWIMRVL
jgi:hypothetical protein